MMSHCYLLHPTVPASETLTNVRVPAVAGHMMSQYFARACELIRLNIVCTVFYVLYVSSCNVFSHCLVFTEMLQGQSYDTRSRIRKLFDVLTEIIEPDLDLLTGLMSGELLTDRQFEKIRSQTDIYDKNRKLLKFLTDENYIGNLDDVLKVFEKTGQRHVANYIRSDGGKHAL